MDITIHIPQLDALTAAINYLATSYSGGGETTAVDSKPKVNRTPPKAKDEKPAATATEEIDAGTGRAEEQAPVQLTVDHVKTMAVRLVASDGGKEKMKTILAQFSTEEHPVTKFSHVPNDKLAEFAQKMVEAGVPLPAE